MLNIYRASAGSGKTYRLTQDYIHLLFDPRRERAHRRILAVTFTNKATEEMKTRIVKELYALGQGEKSDYRAGLMDKFKMDDTAVNERARNLLVTLLHDYSSFSISTIDKFFQQVIRSFAREIGVHGGYNLELDTTSTLEQSVDNLFLDLSKDENKQLLHWLTSYAEERIEQSESWNMRGSIMQLGYEIFKESFQHKAEETNKKLHEREFLTNYRKSLREIKTNFEKAIKETSSNALKIMFSHGVWHDDFAYKTTTTFEKIINGKFEVGSRFVGMANDVSNCYTKAKPQDIKSAIENAYQNGLQACFLKIVEMLEQDIVNYNSASLILKNINTVGILSDLAVQIKKLTAEQNTMLISDTNLLLNKIIDNSETPFVYEKTGITIDNFMIDEFQDTSTLQWKNFQPLVDNSLSAGKLNLVVGDVKQSIYRWRNSDWNLLDEQILHDFRSEQLHEENLDTNWRSDKNIIDFNNSFFHIAAKTLQQKLNEKIEPILPIYPALAQLTGKIEHAYSNVHQQVSSKAGVGSVQISFINQTDEEDKWQELSLIKLMSTVEELQLRGYRPADICVLVRDNKDAKMVIEKLLNFKTTPEANPKVCYDILANEGLLINTAGSVRFILAIMALFVHPDDEIQKTIVNFEYACGKLGKNKNDALNSCFVPKAVPSTNFSDLFSDEENQLMKQLKHSSLFEMVEQLIVTFGIGEWNNEAIFVQAFQDVVFKYSNNKTSDLNSFLNWWKIVENKQFVSSPDNQNSIRIMTIHKSKGLDFKVVIMPFCDWELDKKKGNTTNYLWCEPNTAPFNEVALLPIEYSSMLEKSIFSELYFDEQMHRYVDNLNLAYVAFTRAKNELICMTPAPKKEPESLEKINNLSTLLYNSFKNDLYANSVDYIALDKHFNAESIEFRLGESNQPSYTDKPDTSTNLKVSSYPSINSSDRLHLRHQSADYWLVAGLNTENKLNYGLIMHDILRLINYKTDQERVIQELVMSGRISIDESKIVEREMEAFWHLPETENWFANHLRILNETAILMPTGDQFRPDRVVFDGQKATIIDYKFGDKENKSHIVQVKNYMQLIAQMGYETEGFVCYVSLRKVQQVP